LRAGAGGIRDVGAGSLARRRESLSLELGDGATDGDAAHGVLGHQLRLGREQVARAVDAALDAVTQLDPELLVQRRLRPGSDQLVHHHLTV